MIRLLVQKFPEKSDTYFFIIVEIYTVKIPCYVLWYNFYPALKCDTSTKRSPDKKNNRFSAALFSLAKMKQWTKMAQRKQNLIKKKGGDNQIPSTYRPWTLKLLDCSRRTYCSAVFRQIQSKFPWYGKLWTIITTAPELLLTDFNSFQYLFDVLR